MFAIYFSFLWLQFVKQELTFLFLQKIRGLVLVSYKLINYNNNWQIWHNRVHHTLRKLNFTETRFRERRKVWLILRKLVPAKIIGKLSICESREILLSQKFKIFESREKIIAKLAILCIYVLNCVLKATSDILDHKILLNKIKRVGFSDETIK